MTSRFSLRSPLYEQCLHFCHVFWGRRWLQIFRGGGARTYWLILSISHGLPCRLQSACLQLRCTHCSGWYFLAGWSCKEVALLRHWWFLKFVWLNSRPMTHFKTCHVVMFQTCALAQNFSLCTPTVDCTGMLLIWHTLVSKGWSWCHDEETVHLTLCLLLIKWGKLSSSYSTSVVCLYCTCLLWFAVPFYQVTVPSCCFSSPSQPYLFHFVQPVSAVALQGYKPKFGWNKPLICSASLFFCGAKVTPCMFS